MNPSFGFFSVFFLGFAILLIIADVQQEIITQTILLANMYYIGWHIIREIRKQR